MKLLGGRMQEKKIEKCCEKLKLEIGEGNEIGDKN